tara:strand:+ start:1569 stop:1958 length:390 start_codon:yes stop_codon:yes gene_type:complete
MSTLSVATIKSQSTTASTAFQNSNGVVLGVLCVGFGCLDGTGTLSINSSMRVSSLTDIEPGRYVVNLSTAFSDTHYTVVTGGGLTSQTTNATSATDIRNKQTGSFSIQHEDVDAAFIDVDYSMFAIYDT